MRKFYIMSLIYILVYNLGYSFQFTGKVVDGKTGMPIVEANISFENSSGIGTTTDESGIFSTDASKNSIKENRPNVDDKLRRKPFTYPQTWSKGSQKELDSRDLFTTKN